MAQAPAGVRWLHVHPDYFVTEESWAVVRMANLWREGVLPERGGSQDQAAWTVTAIEIVLAAWSKLRAAEEKRD